MSRSEKSKSKNNRVTPSDSIAYASMPDHATSALTEVILKYEWERLREVNATFLPHPLCRRPLPTSTSLLLSGYKHTPRWCLAVLRCATKWDW